MAVCGDGEGEASGVRLLSERGRGAPDTHATARRHGAVQRIYNMYNMYRGCPMAAARESM